MLDHDSWTCLDLQKLEWLEMSSSFSAAPVRVPEIVLALSVEIYKINELNNKKRKISVQTCVVRVRVDKSNAGRIIWAI